MEISFQDQTVVVTGATRGIGKSLATAFADAGATVVATGTDSEEIGALEAESGPLWHYRTLDFTDDASVEAFLDELTTLGSVDALVNNAGINRLNPIDQVEDQDWDTVLEVNLTGPMKLSRAVARGMKQRGYGRIVNIGSVFGEVSRAGRVVYTTTKYGIRGLTVTSALDLAPHGVLVNCVAPGFVLTDLTREILSTDEREELAAQVPMGRMAEPDDMAAPILFLASTLNTYITAQTLFVDGGFTHV